jgi:hypothetical protein
VDHSIGYWFRFKRRCHTRRLVPRYAWVASQLTQSLLTYPLGVIADRADAQGVHGSGRKFMLLGGFGMMIVADLVLVMAKSPWWGCLYNVECSLVYPTPNKRVFFQPFRNYKVKTPVYNFASSNGVASRAATPRQVFLGYLAVGVHMSMTHANMKAVLSVGSSHSRVVSDSLRGPYWPWSTGILTAK